MASSNELYGSGTVPKQGDTFRMLLVKRLRALILTKGTVSANNFPHTGDTQRSLRVKIDRVLDGI